MPGWPRSRATSPISAGSCAARCRASWARAVSECSARARWRAGPVLLLALCAAAAKPAGPSFDCRYARSYAERTICADPGLAAQDRALATLFDNTRSQGGIDAKALQREEARWLVTARDRCGNADCLRRALQDRQAALLDESLRAASPAEYAETRPFYAPPDVLAAITSMVRRHCTETGGAMLTPPGFSAPAAFPPLIANGHLIRVYAQAGTRVAVLYGARPDMTPSCTIADVAVLPPPGRGETFLQCTMDDPPSSGFGLRRAGRTDIQYYWSVSQSGRLARLPLGVLGDQDGLHCHAPESGE